MPLPLMPKATAVWLVENTALTFDQIADFCGLHMLEIQAIADGEVAGGMQGLDPIINGQLTHEEIKRCEADTKTKLKLLVSNLPQPLVRTKGGRYTPIAKRQDKPDAIAWLVRNYPDITDGQISKLLGTTKTTIASIRDRSHWNISNIKARDPIQLGLCSYAALQEVLDTLRRQGKHIPDQLPVEGEEHRSEPPEFTL
ncbi:cytoplasmic protein [Elstera litoralis]|uniref:Cytoplasmic protein n=1 Tax=Elstera litoralis TaxID=552518 RepID=A0A0F3IRC5_9PROT|nr:cell cycle transcriptional regulator TrcR [Elstera litoralis]KJV09305.1 cytoplasmic protein [Elstera litoralis]